MTSTRHGSPAMFSEENEETITLARGLAQAQRAIRAFTSDQVDAIVDSHGDTYLLRPAQENLRQNERRLRAILESTADVITVVNARGVILTQNRAVRRMLGYEPGELVGKNIFELVHTEDVDRFHDAFFNVIEGFPENAAVPFYHALRDGSFRLLEATMGKLDPSASPSVVFTFRPIADCIPVRGEPDIGGASALPSSEDRHSIALSHGRQIPLRGIQFAE